MNHHDFVEFSFVLNGSGTEIVNGKKYAIHPGVFSFIPPHHLHVIYSESETPIHRFCCMFDIYFLSGSSFDMEFLNLLSRVGRDLPNRTEFSPEAADEMLLLLNALYREFLHPLSPGRSSMIRSKLIEVLICFIRAISQTEPPTISSFHRIKSLEFWDILQHIQIHHKEKITLEVLSETFHFSVPYISRCLSEHLGMSLPQYLHILRIDSAIGMLSFPDMTITDIAYSVGFESFRTFSRAFREIHGKTPSQYRREMISGGQR